SRSVLRCLSTLLLPVANARSLPRTQPPWTNVSLPSGRTSLTVACRSTFGFDDRTQTYTAPAPTTVVLPTSGFVRYETSVPAGRCSHFQDHCEALPHRPPLPVLPE